jgi:hypothetical protein
MGAYGGCNGAKKEPEERLPGSHPTDAGEVLKVVREGLLRPDRTNLFLEAACGCPQTVVNAQPFIDAA